RSSSHNNQQQQQQNDSIELSTTLYLTSLTPSLVDLLLHSLESLLDSSGNLEFNKEKFQLIRRRKGIDENIDEKNGSDKKIIIVYNDHDDDGIKRQDEEKFKEFFDFKKYFSVLCNQRSLLNECNDSLEFG